MSKEDIRIIFCGLIPDGVDFRKLTPKGRDEVRAALDALIRNSQIKAKSK